MLSVAIKMQHMLKHRIHYILQMSVQQYAASETVQHVLLFAQETKNQNLHKVHLPL